MTGLVALLVLGFFLGMRHATDPDHVIAISTIVSRHRTVKSAALIGLAWGLGHTLTILVVGGGIILFGWVIPARLGLSMELAVGMMLIVLGVTNLREVLDQLRGGAAPTHSHPHNHGDYIHNHPHGHAPETHPHRPDQTPVAWFDRQLGSTGLYRLVRPVAVGVVHGLAGSAAIALLVLTAIGNSAWSVFYLIVFGAGTIMGMMLITAGIALPFAHDRMPSSWLGRLKVASGVISVGFGCFLTYHIGIAQGLIPR